MCKNRSQYILLLNVFLVLFAYPPTAKAKDFPAQGRVFLGTTQADLEDVNTELKAQSLEEIDTLPFYGAEILFAPVKFIDVGLRYQHRESIKKESGGGATDYQAELTQDAAQAVVRFSFFKTALFRADIFGAYGGTNTTLKIKSASQDGELTRKKGGDWFANPMSSYGASVGVGWKRIYFFVEAGYENNKIDKFSRTGNLNSNIEAIDLTGSYVSVGLLFDGVEVTKK